MPASSAGPHSFFSLAPSRTKAAKDRCHPHPCLLASGGSDRLELEVVPISSVRWQDGLATACQHVKALLCFCFGWNRVYLSAAARIGKWQLHMMKLVLLSLFLFYVFLIDAWRRNRRLCKISFRIILLSVDLRMDRHPNPIEGI